MQKGIIHIVPQTSNQKCLKRRRFKRHKIILINNYVKKKIIIHPLNQIQYSHCMDRYSIS